MSNYQATAVEKVKTLVSAGLKNLDLGLLRGYMDAKGFDLKVAAKLAEYGFFTPLFRDLVLRNADRPADLELLNQYVEALGVIEPSAAQAYNGSDVQNGRIDSSIANAGLSFGARRFGEGSASSFFTDVSIPQDIRRVPIAIVGYGAAGIMAAHALSRLGFTRITAYEKSKQLGIWSYKNVYGLSRNNPLHLRFFNRVLEAAPGSGDEVRSFLQQLVNLDPVNVRVTGIKPGNMKHKILLGNGDTVEYPIVINAIGLGKPKEVSDPKRMVTTTGKKFSGVRWQQPLEREQVVGQRIVLIGLGNSTAEMLRQIHTITDQGYPVDYRVLTHYPQDSVHNPSAYVPVKNRMFRVFRDVSKPNLVDYQGDLALSRYDYFRALHEGKIISDVTRWEVPTPGVMTVFGKNKKLVDTIAFDKVMTLIGYHHPEEEIRAFGCAFNQEGQSGVFDYDGEVAAKPGHVEARKRLHKGYFGFGSILATPHNPNAIVIPGMIHRIGDLMFGVIMRAAEYRKQELFRCN